MHIHILGICGTFMGSVALLAQQLGYKITGSDNNVYPPMSTQLAKAGIDITQGYDDSQLIPHPDLVVVGNAMTRGVPAIEYMLNANLPYTSGPAFLASILKDKHVLAVAGTHGKTTTTTMTAWILDYAGIDTGFLIGGVPLCFEYSARLGDAPYFVVEADEYDSAFFDKRAKFIHYRPKTLVLNNLEFDHADIFADLSAIQTQFHHLIRTVPSTGQLIVPSDDKALSETLAMGLWSPVVQTSIDGNGTLNARLINDDGSHFELWYQGKKAGEISWGLTGVHNVKNALSAIGASLHVGVALPTACMALCDFRGIKRRMELIGTVHGIDVYDDFAHHPTAIATTLDGAKKRFGKRKIWAVIEPRSNTMKMGHHAGSLADSTKNADHVIWYEPADLGWQLSTVIPPNEHCQIMYDSDEIATYLGKYADMGDVIIIMSNGSFDGLYDKVLAKLD